MNDVLTDDDLADIRRHALAYQWLDTDAPYLTLCAEERAALLREVDRLRAVTRIGPDTIDHSMVICPHCTSQFPAISVNDQKRESDMYTAYEAALAELASLRAERDGLRAAIKAHNDECEQLCGVGDQEGVACKYRPYFPRHCPSCPRNSMLIDEYGKRIDTTATGEG